MMHHRKEGWQKSISRDILSKALQNPLGSQILISGVRDLHSMTFLDHSKHAFNKINYERPCFMCHEMNGKFVAVKKTWKKRSFQFLQGSYFSETLSVMGESVSAVLEVLWWFALKIIFLIANRDSELFERLTQVMTFNVDVKSDVTPSRSLQGLASFLQEVAPLFIRLSKK